MQAIEWKDMRTDKHLLPTIKAFRRVREFFDALRAPSAFSKVLALFLLLTCSFGCAPSSSPDAGNQKQSASGAGDLPEITDEMLRKEINDAYVREVPEENGASEPISWRFDDEEPKEFTVVERQIEGDRATIIIDIKTQSAPHSRSPRYLAGQIRTKWELQTGWALRTWEIVDTENVSMKYKNLPKPPVQNSNR